MGGNEASTHKYISELMGKATIDAKQHGKSSGRNGNYSTNFQIQGRELLTPDEVRSLNRKKAILLISGELPIVDRKYNLLKHPNIHLSADGKGAEYRHGEPRSAIGTLAFDFGEKALARAAPMEPMAETKYLLLSETELEELLSKHT